MTTTAIIRQRQISWARRALGMFVVVWLNLVLQPCVMAMDGGMDHDCPNCPPSHQQHPIDRDMILGDEPCATHPADCSAVDEFNHDGRLSQLKVKDTAHELPTAIVSIANLVPNLQATCERELHSTRSPTPVSTTPLNVLYCVYLN